MVLLVLVGVDCCFTPSAVVVISTSFPLFVPLLLPPPTTPLPTLLLNHDDDAADVDVSLLLLSLLLVLVAGHIKYNASKGDLTSQLSIFATCVPQSSIFFGGVIKS